MRANFFYTFILVFTIYDISFAQSKKDIKTNKIKSITEFVSSFENGKEVTYKVHYTAFNKNGNIIEDTEYNNDGTIKKQETAKYDTNNNKIEETYYCQKKSSKTNPNPTAIVNIKTLNKYNAHNDKIEEEELDISNGQLIKKCIFSYNSKGERNIEESFNSEKKLIKKVIFIYDNKGLKTEKKTYNESNELEMTKKYVYEF